MLYKHYGGIEFFENKPIPLLVSCLENAVRKEQEIPNIILQLLNAISPEDYSFSNKKISKKMRSKEEIYKDYGLS